MADYDLTPVLVPEVHSRFRTIQTPLPVPESLPLFEALRASEPRFMFGVPPVVWHDARDFTVTDPWGNRWIDWSSGVVLTNAGHGRSEIAAALRALLDRPLLATFLFAHEGRRELVELLRALSPAPEHYRVFLLTTGSEATEHCIKLSKAYALAKYGKQRNVFVTFDNAFHGRTMGALLAGGMDAQKAWLNPRDPSFVQVLFPDGYKNPDTSFELFERSLADRGITPDRICGVMTESFQGVGPDFMPATYARKLEHFCRRHDIVLSVDEVQSGFGRTGKTFCFQHYGIRPDLIACGKGISSSLPLAAVIGRGEIMDRFPPGSMTSTHSTSPLAVAAAIESIKLLKGERLAERAERLGTWFIPELERIQQKHPDRLGCCHGKGLVAGIQVVQPGTRDPDPDLAFRINLACFHKGLLMTGPVGVAGECLKIAPPLSISEEALRESVAVFEEAADEALSN